MVWHDICTISTSVDDGFQGRGKQALRGAGSQHGGERHHRCNGPDYGTDRSVCADISAGPRADPSGSDLLYKLRRSVRLFLYDRPACDILQTGRQKAMVEEIQEMMTDIKERVETLRGCL